MAFDIEKIEKPFGHICKIDADFILKKGFCSTIVVINRFNSNDVPLYTQEQVERIVAEAIKQKELK